MVTGSDDKTCALWDIRNLNFKLRDYQKHNESINNVRFSKI